MKANDSQILIIGGGVIGLGIARELHKRGVGKITLLEKSVCGRESSWAAGGILGPQAEADTGGEFFDFCSLSRDLYPRLADELFDETGIDIELDRSGTLYLAFTDDEIRNLQKRREWQKNAGLPVEYLTAEGVLRAEPLVSPDVRGALFFPNDWQVDNRKLLAALKRYADLNGIDIREQTTIESLMLESGRVNGAIAGEASFAADKTVIATGAWTSLIKLGQSEMPFSIEPVRGQMILFQAAERLFKRVIYSSRGYLVPRRDGRILAGSTSENVGFDRLITDEAATSIRDLATEIAPTTADLPIVDHWTGLRPFAPDGLPILGPIDGVRDVFVATAHYRNGILLVPLTAQLAAEWLLDGVQSKFFQLFGADRFRRHRTGTVG